MYKILSDGIIHPRNLLRYRNKSGWFVLAYFAVLALFCTIGAGLYYYSYARSSGFTAENAACAYEDGTLVCEDATHDYETPLDFFGGDAYFLPESTDAASLDVAGGFVLIFQEKYVAFFSEGQCVTVLDVSPQLAAGLTLPALMESLTTGFLIAAILGNFVGNILLLAAFTLMSAIPLLRLRGYIRFGKAYTVLAFASVSFALVLTFHNILGLPDWALMLLMVVSFRSSFLVIRELFDQAYAYLAPREPQAPEDGEEGGGENEDDKPESGDDDSPDA